MGKRMIRNKKLTDFENISGVKVLQFSLQVRFFPEVVKSGQSNELYFDTICSISDILTAKETILDWSVQTLTSNFLNEKEQ
jgi:hypothetical protein